MKKIVIASIMAIAAASAFAGSATAEYQAADGQYGSAGNTALVLTVKENITTNIAVDIGGTNTQAAGNSALSTRVEGGVTYALPIYGVTPSVRVGAGEKYTNGANTEYWSVEPAVAYGINDKWTVKAGYRYRTAIDGGVADKTRTARVGAAYAITKVDSIGVRLDDVRGDSNLNVVAVSFTHSF